MERLPEEHKAKWLAGSALYSADQAMLSVMSTALSRLNSFIDSEMEQILCFGTALDAEKFCNEKSAIFIVLPEEDQSKYFMVSLIIQQLYREILVIADENGGKLDNRVMFYADEFGTFPKIEGAEAMFSASRSRRISIVAIIQSFAQLNKNYGKEGQEIITDNTQLTIFGGFAPNSQSAEVLSKALGEQTILSGSVSHGKDKSQSLQMIGRPLLIVDELKSMPKGQFIVMKTGTHPMISPLKLYFKWGISFEEPYILEDKGARTVTYMSKELLMRWKSSIRSRKKRFRKMMRILRKNLIKEEKFQRREDDIDLRFSREIYEYGLPHRAVAVYMYLSNRANKNKECFPSVRMIAEDLHLSKSTVFRALNDLETAGLITREKRFRTSGGRSSTLYKLKEK